MRRVLLPAALFLLVFAAFAGCGQKQDAEVVLDIEECAAQLLAEVDFADELTKIDGEMVQALYLLGEDAESFAVYVSSGATAEEIAVLQPSICRRQKNRGSRIKALPNKGKFCRLPAG